MSFPRWLRIDDPVKAKPMIAAFLQPASPWHSGLLYTDSNEQTWYLHLAFHYDLRQEEPTATGAWVEPPIPALFAEQVAAMCDLVWSRHGENGLPYALRYDAAYFDQTGELRGGPEEHGLTCSTFILAVFASAQLRLVDLSSWKDREDDRTAQERIVDFLKKRRAHASHIEAVSKQVGCIRVRPSEAVGACAHPLPCAFEQAKEAGELLQQKISQILSQ
jgi:hypothetical protein